MIGVFVNAAAIVFGGLIGSIIGKRFPDKLADTVIKAMGVFSLVVGIQGAIKGTKTMLILISLVLGTVVGELIDIDHYIERLGDYIKKKVVKDGDARNARFTDAFMTTSAFMGIGAMALLGSIEAGLLHKYDVFFLKSMMDFVSAVVFATTMGIGVAFSSITIIILQGTMTLLASLIKPIAENTIMMNEITGCANLMIVGIGLNLIGATKIKIANIMPSIFFVPILFYLF